MENLALIRELSKYEIKGNFDFYKVIREIVQKIILCSLSNQNFFEYSAFYGGTCLRLFRNLERFSEDLDFVLVKKDDKEFKNYIDVVIEDLRNFGFVAEYKLVEFEYKTFTTEVITSIIKIDLNSIKNIVNDRYKYSFTHGHPLQIKLDLSTTPINSSIYEIKNSNFPKNYKVRILNYPSMFAGKLCAILNRHYKFRVKGRDYFDYMHYVNNNIAINLDYINEKLNVNLSFSEFKILLKKKFEEVDFNKICNDLKPFIKADYNLENLNNENLLKTIDKLIQYK